MKNILPAILISFTFVGLLISQMLINGQKLSASKSEKIVEKFTFYENQFKKLKTTELKYSDFNISKIDKPIIVVNFWASWCQPCIGEFKSLNSLVEKYGEKVFVLGINNDTDEPLKQIEKMKTKHGLKFPSIVDKEGDIASMFNITTIPASIVFHNGKVIATYYSENDFMSDEFISLIKRKTN